MPHPTHFFSSPLFAAALAVALTCLPAQSRAAAPAAITVIGYGGSNGTSTGYGFDDQDYTGAGRGVAGSLLSGGIGELADGAKNMPVGAGLWNYLPYVMWDVVSPVLSFDLGSRHDVASVLGHLIHYPGAAVNLPVQASVRFSDDRVSWGPATLRVFSNTERLADNLTDDLRPTLDLFAGAGQGRFVELTVQSAGRWTGLSEVSFFGSVTAVPESGTWLLMLGGLAVVGGFARRRGRDSVLHKL